MSATTALQRIRKTLWDSRNQLIKAMPKNWEGEREIQSVYLTVANNQSLQTCQPESIIQAAMMSAHLGLPVNSLGLAFLVPYKNQAKLQIGYKGYIDLAIRASNGAIIDIEADAVYENDQFTFSKTSAQKIDHKPLLRGDRGKPYVFYAIAYFLSGHQKVCVMRIDEVERIRKTSPSANSGPWASHYDEMAKKTCIKRLCKTLPQNTSNKLAIAEEVESRAETDKDYREIIGDSYINVEAETAEDQTENSSINDQTIDQKTTSKTLNKEIEKRSQLVQTAWSTLIDLCAALQGYDKTIAGPGDPAKMSDKDILDAVQRRQKQLENYQR